MNEKHLLNARLASWAETEGITLNWVRGALRLDLADGATGTVLSFAPDFWERFETASEAQREQALMLISQDVVLLYRPPVARHAYVIDVPTNYLQ